MCTFSVACNRFFKQGEVSCWTHSDGKGHSRIEIVAEHVEFKPQFKKGEGQPKPVDGQVQEEAELKEAASF